MKPLPSGDLRCNLATWLVPIDALPAVARAMLDALPPEAFDPGFLGQKLETTYFDTAALALRKARRRGERYLTLRLRCYDAPGGATVYALSAKTESEKWRQTIPTPLAEALEVPGANVLQLVRSVLPGNLLARLLDVSGEEPLLPAVKICCRRYAVENTADRYTLDVGVHTDTGRCLPASILEYKSTDPDRTPPTSLMQLGLRPIKMSKFLWSTNSGG